MKLSYLRQGVTFVVFAFFVLVVESVALTVKLDPIQKTTDQNGLAKGTFAGPEGAVGNLFVRPLHEANDPEVDPLPLLLTIQNDGVSKKVELNMWATNAYGQKINWTQKLVVNFADGELTREIPIFFKGGSGYCDIHVNATELNGKGLGKSSALSSSQASLAIATLPPPWPGVKKYSFFSSNAHTCNGNWDFFKTIGMKIIRYSGVENQNLPAYDLWPLTLEIAGTYSLDKARDRFKKFQDLTMVEFINEPWIYGWQWQRPAKDYQDAAKQWLEMTKQTLPKALTFAHSSVMLFTDIIEGYPDTYKGLLDVLADHPYDPCSELNTNRPGSLLSSIDAGMVITRRAGVPYAGLTEGGQWGAKTGTNTDVTAYKIAQHYLIPFLAGHILGCCECGQLGVAPGWTLPNNAFAVTAFFLEDRVPLADIWPYNLV